MTSVFTTKYSVIGDNHNDYVFHSKVESTCGYSKLYFLRSLPGLNTKSEVGGTVGFKVVVSKYKKGS